MTLLDAALRYADAGLLVFPLEPREKRPCGQLVPTGFKQASTDPQIIADWWRAVPEANIGLPCQLNRLCTLDVDARDGGLEAWAAFRANRKLPKTWAATTGGGGLHFCFNLPVDHLRGKLCDQATGEILPGVDIKVAGYIAVWCSVHPSGRLYEWRPGYAPWECELADAPDWALAGMVRPERPAPTPMPQSTVPTGDRLSDQEVARAALPLLAGGRADSYDPWIAVGQALHATDDGLLTDWVAWSQQSPSFESADDCERHWRSFRPGGGLTVAALVAWVREDGHADFLRPGWRAGANGQLGTPRATRSASSAAAVQTAPLRDVDAEEALRFAADGRPVISTEGRQLREVVDDALRVLEATNNPAAFLRRSGRVVRVQWDETDWPTISDVGEHALRGRLARMANWHGSKGRVIDPPSSVSQTILSEPDLPLPPLIGLTQVPTMRPDGSVLSEPGYDPATKLFYAPPGRLVVPPIPEEPTAEQVAKARDLLLHIIADFPFVDEASRANVIATWLTPVNRASFTGPVGCSIIDAPSPGTGKSLLVECICRTVSGRSTFLTAPEDEDEWRKRLTSLLIGGASVIVIDNISGVFKSDQLSAAITADWWEDRELGRSGMIRVQQRATWIATGNNIALGGDLPRRCYHTRLDAEISRPWERVGFEIEDLRAYVDGIRGRVLTALLTLSRAWWVAGCPKVFVKPLGGFEPWSQTVGGILAFSGIDGFLGNQDAMYEQADEGGAETEQFLRAWHDIFEDLPVKTADVLAAMRDQKVQSLRLREALPSWALDTHGNVDARKLGTNLRFLIDRRYGQDGICLKRAEDDKHAKTAMWRVVISAGSAGSCGESTTHTRENGQLGGQYDVRFVGSGGGNSRNYPHSPQTVSDPSGDDDWDPFTEE